MNIGLNLTKNTLKFNHLLSIIKEKTTDYRQCNFINVSNHDMLEKNISNLDILLTYNINSDIFQQASNKLKWIHFGVAGVEKSLFPDIIKSKTILTNCSGIHAGPVSEFILASISVSSSFNALIPLLYQQLPYGNIKVF